LLKIGPVATDRFQRTCVNGLHRAAAVIAADEVKGARNDTIESPRGAPTLDGGRSGMRMIARRLMMTVWPLLLAAPLVSAAGTGPASDAGPAGAKATETETTPAEAKAEVGPFTDPQDGAFDVSTWLLERKGFLPVPLIISEPAIGYGGGLAALFFRGTLGEGMSSRRLSPPDIYGVMLAGTDNGTRFGGAFGMKTFAQENWRWKGAVGRPDINIDFYGAGGDLGTGDASIAYNLEG